MTYTMDDKVFDVRLIPEFCGSVTDLQIVEWIENADKFNAFDQFVTRRLRRGESVEEFLADLHRLTRLVGELLPDRWMTCTFVSGSEVRGVHTGHGYSAANNGVFDAIKLGIFHRSTRETPREESVRASLLPEQGKAGNYLL